MSTPYSTGVSLGPRYAGMAVGYRHLTLAGATLLPFTTASVVATTILGNFTVLGGMPPPAVKPARIVWGTAGQDLDQEVFEGIKYAATPFDTIVSLGPRYAGLALGYRLVDLSETVVSPFTTTGVIEANIPGDYVPASGVNLSGGFQGRVVYGTASADLAEEWVNAAPATTGLVFEGALRSYLLANLPSLADCYLDETQATPGSGPFAIVSPLNETPDWTSDPAAYPTDYNVQLSFVGPDSSVTRSVRDAAYQLFTPRRNTDGTPANPPLVFGDGAMPPFGSLPGMKRQVRQKVAGPGGQPVWVFLFDCRFYLTRAS